MNANDIKFLDCTIRDGGYVNRWHFSDECVKDTIVTLDKAGYDFVEIGFRNKPEIYNNKPCGKWRYCQEEDIVKVVPGKKDRTIKISVMADYKSSSIDLFPRVEETVIDMVRVAFHLPDLVGALDFCKQLKQLGYIVCANAMATMNYTPELMEKLCFLAHHSQIDYLYLADSYGCLTPDDTEKIICDMADKLPDDCKAQLGVHLHNNIQNGLANFFRLSNKGLVNIVDSTVLGMGRGAGNLCTELVVHSHSKFNESALRNVCLLAEKYILPFYGATGKWGSTLQFIISAHFKCHPNYILKLQDYGITSIDKIWMYIKNVSDAGKHKMFDIEYLNSLVAKNTVHSN